MPLWSFLIFLMRLQRYPPASAQEGKSLLAPVGFGLNESGLWWHALAMLSVHVSVCMCVHKGKVEEKGQVPSLTWDVVISVLLENHDKFCSDHTTTILNSGGQNGMTKWGVRQQRIYVLKHKKCFLFQERAVHFIWKSLCLGLSVVSVGLSQGGGQKCKTEERQSRSLEKERHITTIFFFKFTLTLEHLQMTVHPMQLLSFDRQNWQHNCTLSKKYSCTWLYC